MITANKGTLEIDGKNKELFFELDTIIKWAIEEQPEMMQAIISNRGDDLLNANVREEIVAGLDRILKEAIKLEKEGGEKDD